MVRPWPGASPTSESSLFSSSLIRHEPIAGVQLRPPIGLIQLPVRFQREAEIVGLGGRDRIVRVDNLADDIQIVFLRLLVHRAAAAKSGHQIVVKPARLLAGDSRELYK